MSLSVSSRTRPVEVRLPDLGVFAFESSHAADFSMEPSRHDFWELFFVLSGAGKFWLEGECLPCQSNGVIVVPPGTTHRIEDEPDDPLSLYALCLAPHWVRVGIREREDLEAGSLPIPRALCDRLRTGLRQLLFEQTMNQPGAGLLIAGKALEWLGLLVRGRLACQRNATNGGLARVMEEYLVELHQRFFEPTDLDHEAQRLGMSRRRFTQLFREITGQSWLQYLTTLRIDYARRLLLNTRRSVTAIAFECGFEELSSFYRAFKRSTGSAPLPWRDRGKP